MTEWQIAQMNLATALYPLDDPGMAEFVARLDEVNALADRSPEFVWRLRSESGNATDIRVGGDPRLIVNLSVWRSVEALFDFAYRSAHRLVMVKRRQWFQPPAGPYQVLWWIEAGKRPTVDDGLARLRRLESEGPGQEASTFKAKFPPPGAMGEPLDLDPEPCCAGWTL